MGSALPQRARTYAPLAVGIRFGLGDVDHQAIGPLRQFQRAFDDVGFHLVIKVVSDHGGRVECMEKLARDPDPQIDDAAVFLGNGPCPLLCLRFAAFQQVHEIERERKDDGRATLVGNDVESREIA